MEEIKSKNKTQSQSYSGNKRFSCVCASSACESHDCQSASDLLYHNTLQNIACRVQWVKSRLFERRSTIKANWHHFRFKIKHCLNDPAFCSSPSVETQLLADLENCDRNNTSLLLEIKEILTDLDQMDLNMKALTHLASYEDVLYLEEHMEKLAVLQVIG